MLTRSTWHALVDLLYPPRCLVCRGTPRARQDRFCEQCTREIFYNSDLSCPRCASTVGPYVVHDGQCAYCRPRSFAFDAALRLGKYDGALRKAILFIKHRHNEGLADRLASRWGVEQQSRLVEWGVHAVVPVPLFWMNRLWRGYNQSGALARGLAERLGVKYQSRWLYRTRRTAKQSLLGPTARLDNVRGAFQASVPLAGMRILLVDDVLTTGATASEAASALKRGGASWVGVAVLARAEG